MTAARRGEAPAAAGPGWVEAVGRCVAQVVRVSRALAALGILVSLGLIVYAVVWRYCFNRAPTWVDDAVGFLLVGVVMCATAATLREGEHIGVDILTAKLSGPARRWAEAWAMASVALISAMLVANGWETAMSSRMLGIMTTGQLEWPVWMLQLLLPFGGATMLLVALEALLRIALGLPSPQPSPRPFSAQERQA